MGLKSTDFGWFKDNAIGLVHNIILGLCWVLYLTNTDTVSVESKPNVAFWDVSYFYFLGWYLHWHFTFADTDCKRGHQYGFHNIMSALHFVCCTAYFVEWENTGWVTLAVKTFVFSNYSIVFGALQLASLLLFQFNNIVGIFWDKKLLKID
jgi:hypothetical protein